MTLTSTPIPGLYVCDPKVFTDSRGLFVKTFHDGAFREHGCAFEMKESMYSQSRRDVIRGMHFQRPPSDHSKLVYCLAGKILDVVVDIRMGSPTYGKHHAEVLSADNHRGLFIPSGLAHGFVSLEDNSLVAYSSSFVYAPEDDLGIRWDSFGYDWPINPGSANVSDRDMDHPALADYASPFRFGS